MLGVALVLAGSVALATHANPPPPTALDGGLAAVRNFGAPAATPEEWRVEGAYAAVAMDMHANALTGLARRGPSSEVILASLALPPDTAAGLRRFAAVGWWDRGLLSVEGPMARVLVLNGATAGLALQAREPAQATFALPPGVTAVQLDPQTVEFRRDAPVYVLRVAHGEGALRAAGDRVEVQLARGADVHGWVPGYPATLALQELVFGRLAWTAPSR